MSLSGNAEICKWYYTINSKYISPLSIANQWVRISDFHDKFIDEQTDEDDDTDLYITSKVHFTTTNHNTNSYWSGFCGDSMKLLNPSCHYIASELERMAEMATNKLERTKLDFMERGDTTFKIEYNYGN